MTRTVMLLVLAAFFILAGFYLWREWRKDSCSESGGEWHQASGSCGSRMG
jgi:hypothetical protein